MQPLVSVIMPANNAAATITAAIRSAAAQTYENIEILVIDDGSEDSTADLAEEFARLDDRVKVFRRAGEGVSAALNMALSVARGDYVARLDSDDLWHPSKLAKQVELALRNPDCAFIYSFVRYIDEDDRVLHDGPRQCFPSLALCQGLYESLVGVGSSAMMKRRAAIEAGGYDESLNGWEDLLLQLQITAVYPLAFVPEFLVGYRVRRDSLTADPRNMLNNWRTARALLRGHFTQAPAYVHDWAHGSRVGQMAESFAWRGRYGRCMFLLAEALWHDPGWTLRFLGYRSWRSLKRRLGRRGERPFGPDFLTCDPEQPTGQEQFAVPAESDLLRRLNAKRTRHLRELDLALGLISHPPEGDAATSRAERTGP